MAYRIVARVKSPSTHRSLIAALRAYGFNPLDGGEGGLPGVDNLFGPEGFPVQVPDEEAADATVLATALLQEMTGDGTQNSHISGR